jgi:hypothetical protein
MTGRFRTVKKRLRDLGLDHVKRALSNKENPLSRLEVEFVRTSCHILGISSEVTMKAIVKKAKEKGGGGPAKEGDGLIALPTGRTWGQGGET